METNKTELEWAEEPLLQPSNVGKKVHLKPTDTPTQPVNADMYAQQITEFLAEHTRSVIGTSVTLPRNIGNRAQRRRKEARK